MVIKTRKGQIFLLFLIIIFLFSFGCANPPKKQLTVAAASDLRLAFEEIGQAFTARYNIPVVFNYGATGQLAQQIVHGAPVDVFAAADVATIQRLAHQGFILPQSLYRYGEGRLALVTSPSFPRPLTSLQELLQSEVKKIALANPQHAPYGLAAQEALIKSGLWDKLEDKLVYGQSIRDALTLVESGNVEVGLISHSLVIHGNLPYTLIDSKIHNPIIQSLGITTASQHQKEAEKFIQFLRGPEGQQILKKYGFELPGEAHD